MSPHIPQAVALLAEKARQHQARLNRARRTYLRTLVLDEPTSPQVLADAIETLGITPADFLHDAQSGQLHRDSLALIPKLETQIRDHRNHTPPPEPTDSDDHACTPDDELRQLQDQFELAHRHVLEAPRRSPRLFSPEAQKLLESPADPIPDPQPESAPSRANSPEPPPIADLPTPGVPPVPANAHTSVLPDEWAPL